MKPIIISTHRTGSSLLCRRLFNIAKHNWGYLSNLYKFLNIGPAFQQIFEENDGITYLKETINYNPPRVWWINKEEEIEKRLNILNKNDVYMVKIHAMHVTPRIFEFIKSKKYTVFYTHRRNKLDQYLSYMAAIHNSKWKFSDKDKPIEEIRYDRKWTERFIEQFDTMTKIRNEIPGIDIWYEDFINAGGDESAVLQLSKINATLPKSAIDIVPTRYMNSDRESLIINKSEWMSDREQILKQFNKL